MLSSRFFCDQILIIYIRYIVKFPFPCNAVGYFYREDGLREFYVQLLPICSPISQPSLTLSVVTGAFTINFVKHLCQKRHWCKRSSCLYTPSHISLVTTVLTNGLNKCQTNGKLRCSCLNLPVKQLHQERAVRYFHFFVILADPSS